MASPGAGGSARRWKFWAISALITGLLLSGLPLTGASLVPSAVSPISHAPASLAPTASAPAASPRPAGPPVTVTNESLGPVYASTKIVPSSTNAPCYADNYTFDVFTYCWANNQNPSIVTLANGHIGVGYSIYTALGPQCNATGGTNLSSWTVTSVAWSISKNNGTTFGPTRYLTDQNCRYPEETSPSFAAVSNGSVYGTFVLSNLSVNHSAAIPYPPQPLFPPDWWNTSGDALGWVSSSNNGTTWSNVSEIPGITDAARPQVAVHGSDIYIVYIDPQNGSSAYYSGLGLCCTLFPAQEIEFIHSSNGGATWSSPVTLPALNATAGWTATSPTIAVSATGTVSVAYVTDQTCVEYCYSPTSSVYAYEIVVSSSVNSGTSWSTPVAVSASLAGSYYDYPAYYGDYYHYGGYEAPYMQQPSTSIAYAPTGTALYVAYSGTYVKSLSVPYYNWEYPGVFAAYSANGGTTWTDSLVADNPSTTSYDAYYQPAVAVNATAAFVNYLIANDTYCHNSGSVVCSPFDGGYSAWLATTTNNGTSWSSTYTAISPKMYYPFYSEDAFQGWSSSITISHAGNPVAATTLPGSYTYTDLFIGSTLYFYEDYYANVTVSTVATVNTTYAVFTEHGLKHGTPWAFSFDGYDMMANTTAINVTNVPLGIGSLVIVSSSSTAYGVVETSMLSIPTFYVFRAPTAVDVNFSTSYAVTFFLEPKTIPDLEVEIDYGGTFYEVYTYTGAIQPYAYPSMPWLFPGNVTLTFTSYGEPPVTYWNGTGNGSYTGGGVELNLTLHGPVNETAWGGSFGYSTEQFTAVNLPATPSFTSTYSITFDGTTESALAGTELNVTNVSTGGYTVSDIQATSNVTGWEYFGWVEGGSDTVVVPAQPTVVLNFADVDVAAPVGTVTFHANGIGPGTVWSVAFNGTTYSASTPWLNVSTKPGTFPWSVGSAVASNASVGYAPVGTGSTVSVTTGATVTIDYTSAYRVDVVAGLGGSVSAPGNHWVAAGTLASYLASPSNDYTFGGWTGAGAGSYTGSNGSANVTVNGAITETASFYPLPDARFNVTFQESGIPSGVWWTVYLNGVGYSSNTSQLMVPDLLSCAAGTSGQYRVAVPDAYDTATQATRYGTVGEVPAQLCTNGGLVQPLTFAPEFEVSVTATSGGTAYVADANAQSNESVWASVNDTVELTALPNTSYTFGGWNGTGTGAYSGNDQATAISVGSPVAEFATFVPIAPPKHPAYHVTFTATVKFPAGTTWSVGINGSSFAAIGTSVTVYGLQAGPYTALISGAVSADGLSKWAAADTKISVPVSGNGSVPVSFGKASYWVSIHTTQGGSATVASGWQDAGTALALNVSVNLGYQFVNWSGTGDGSVNASSPTVTVTVLGPVTETATFAPQPVTTTVASTVWQSGSTLAVLAAVGLLVGLIVGIAVRRLRAAPAAGAPASGAPAAWSGPTGDPNAPSGGNP